ncbi:hypothetical protein [Croceiramulus getboli]|nr:hypothetical protein P8624_07620 [Flavobacteriaceae bacterium YJPT1-3]
MRIVLIIVGIVLIAIGLYQALVPQEVLAIGEFEINAKEGWTTEALVILGLGVLVLLAGTLKRK